MKLTRSENIQSRGPPLGVRTLRVCGPNEAPKTAKNGLYGSCPSLNKAIQAKDETVTVEAQARVMVLELDGVMALSRPEMGGCAGMEIKSAVLYPAASPSRRWMLAELADSAEFLPWLKGLLARGLKTGHDTLLGLGDGANWVENAFDEVGALPITDVYHSAQYLERVMIALGWSESRREWQQRAWCRGEVAAREWLEQRLPAPDPKLQ